MLRKLQKDRSGANPIASAIIVLALVTVVLAGMQMGFIPNPFAPEDTPTAQPLFDVQWDLNSDCDRTERGETVSGNVLLYSYNDNNIDGLGDCTIRWVVQNRNAGDSDLLWSFDAALVDYTRIVGSGGPLIGIINYTSLGQVDQHDDITWTTISSGAPTLSSHLVGSMVVATSLDWGTGMTDTISATINLSPTAFALVTTSITPELVFDIGGHRMVVRFSESA